MRRVTAGLGSLVAAAGLATTFALSAGAAPQEGLRGQSARAVSDDLPNATEEKRRELREVAIKKVLAGKLKVQQRGASEVVEGRSARPRPRASRPRTSTSSSRARRRTRSSSSSPSSGTSAHPRYPDQDTDPNTPGPTRFDGPLHNQIPEPDRTQGQQDDLAGGLQPRALPGPVLRHERRRRLAEDVLRAPVVGPLQRRRHGHRLGQGPATTRRATAAATASRAPSIDLRELVGPDPATR